MARRRECHRGDLSGKQGEPQPRGPRGKRKEGKAQHVREGRQPGLVNLNRGRRRQEADTQHEFSSALRDVLGSGLHLWKE